MNITGKAEMMLPCWPADGKRYAIFCSTMKNASADGSTKILCKPSPKASHTIRNITANMHSAAFIVISPSLFHYMDERWTGKFSIMDFYLQTCREARIGGRLTDTLRLIDIGKPETLTQAEEFLASL